MSYDSDVTAESYKPKPRKTSPFKTALAEFLSLSLHAYAESLPDPDKTSAN